MLPTVINCMRRYISGEYIAETIPSVCRVLAVTFTLLSGCGGKEGPAPQVDRIARRVDLETRRNAQSQQSLTDRLADLKTTERIYRALRHNNIPYQHLQKIRVSTRLGLSTVTGVAASDGERALIEKAAASVLGTARLKLDLNVGKPAKGK